MTRMYILVNKDLKMSKGKTAAQVAHAASRVAENNGAAETVIVLEAHESQLRNLSQYLFDKDIHNVLYIDEGVNEIPPFSITALGVAPIDDEDDETRELFQGFPLMEDQKWLKKFYS
jgi:peptidyl-tRNA hydrolase